MKYNSLSKNQSANITRGITALLMIFYFTTTSFAQSNSFIFNGNTIELDEKIISHFGADSDYLQQLKTNNTDLLFYLNYFAKEAYTIEDIHEKANVLGVSDLINIPKSEKSLATQFIPTNHASFNILAYDIQLLDKQQVFKTGIGSEAIIVKSKKAFLEKYNTYRNSFLK